MLHKETADINMTLFGIKECFQSIIEGRKPNFRITQTTRLLQNCFIDDNHKIILIGTISPSTTDIEHSRDTLDYVCRINNK